MQNITIIGRLGRDAALREMTNGTRFVSFTVAVNSHIRGAEKTTWYDVMSFNQNHMGNLVKYLKKGSSVAVVGDLDASTQKGNDGVERLRLSVVADRIDFAGGATSGSTENSVTENTTTKDEHINIVTAQAEANPKPKKKKAKVDDEDIVVATTVVAESSNNEDDLPF